MIVVTLLLIPVAVLFIALGLVNGSSSLLITAIVVSLLAAVALVIGTRQAAARRHEQPLRRDPESDEPVSFAEDSLSAPAPPAGESRRREQAFWDEAAEARAAGARDATTRSDDGAEAFGPAGADYADSDSHSDSAPAAPGPTRSVDDEQSWRPAATGRSDEPGQTDQPGHTGQPGQKDQPGHTGQPGQKDQPEPAGQSGQADEFAEPDDDDPDDEPLPQSVRPADAVLVARFDTEVLVVDGRPRYHMADCPHLVGRLTEPLPVNEAVELGFSPCGLCRPVDRLVAAVAQQR